MRTWINPHTDYRPDDGREIHCMTEFGFEFTATACNNGVLAHLPNGDREYIAYDGGASRMIGWWSY